MSLKHSGDGGFSLLLVELFSALEGVEPGSAADPSDWRTAHLGELEGGEISDGDLSIRSFFRKTFFPGACFERLSSFRTNFLTSIKSVSESQE